MQLKDSNINITGSLTIKKFNSNNELTQELHVPNLVVKTGKEYIMNRMVGNTPDVINLMAIGTSGTQPALDNTALFSKIAEFPIDEPITSATDVTIEYSALFDATTRIGNVVEAGLFSASIHSLAFNGTSDVTITTVGNVSDGNFVVGASYKITTVGTTNWNAVAGTVGVSYAPGMTLTAKLTSGGGNGEADRNYATIDSVAHGYNTGDMVLYTSASPLGGILSANYYYIIKVDDDQFRLATSYKNATLTNPIAIGASVGTGTQTLGKYSLDTMLCRSTFPVVTKSDGDVISINWVVRIG